MYAFDIVRNDLPLFSVSPSSYRFRSRAVVSTLLLNWNSTYRRHCKRNWLELCEPNWFHRTAVTDKMSQCRSTDGTSTKPSIGTGRFMTGKGMLCTTWMLKTLSGKVSISKLLSARKYMTSSIFDIISAELYGVPNVFKHDLSSLLCKIRASSGLKSIRRYCGRFARIETRQSFALPWGHYMDHFHSIQENIFNY